MKKVSFYTHEEKEMENGETAYVDVYIDINTHKLSIRSTVAGEWLNEQECIKVIFGNREVSKEELKAWKQENIKKHNNRIKSGVFKPPVTRNQAEEDNLWK